MVKCVRVHWMGDLPLECYNWDVADEQQFKPYIRTKLRKKQADRKRYLRRKQDQAQANDSLPTLGNELPSTTL